MSVHARAHRPASFRGLGMEGEAGHGGAVGRGELAGLGDVSQRGVGSAGPLQPLIAERGVTDVLVNGPDDVWVDRGRGLERRTAVLGDEEGVRALAVRLAALAGQRLDDACPVVDARLPDGTRLHAVLPPVSASGVLMSLRVPRRRPFTLPELVACGTVHPALVPVLRELMVGRANGLLTGGTGTGKTTLLATLLALAAADERVVLVEEVPELTPDHPHVVGLVVRRPNVEGAGRVDLPELVRHALRMRPDRIVLGEARGAELREVLAALNTGHDGGWATMHANALHDVPSRLMALGALAGLDPASVAAQASSGLDVVVHLNRVGGRRRVTQVGVVVDAASRGAPDAQRHGSAGAPGLHVLEAVTADGDGARRGPGWGLLTERWPAVSDG
ncbi:TadA family conjugal transfer-associated ATPase [Isoptericola sp. b441]|uniref:TadA family conjugal transfer-associated ATPase n=1 Tax=Actinotalea lenta TaxID=3064654 RepID=A0ABT9D6R7_9CELL|nr:TadA family conjugal transfer-associated ATPase [Isoptericola sp. b441]MDO8106532.1 TadA family conjugal transfer-associated ATPase [Isoptericola sp. b441]